MEVTRLFKWLIILQLFSACSNSPEYESGEIKTLNLIRQAFAKPKTEKIYLNAKAILNRDMIDKANTSVLYVELESGQNGTLTPYPEKGDGQTWIGADGATITFKQGVLKASRGMGNDLMGSYSTMPPWGKIGKASSYVRELSMITGNNKLNNHFFECQMTKTYGTQTIDIFEKTFTTNYFIEDCKGLKSSFKNEYYVDEREIVRKSNQYHSNTIGYIKTERLEQ